MVSPSKKHSRVASQQSNKCKLIKGLKPLANYKFYLDIEKHHVSSKIEAKIKELGGSIEFFLAKEVTHFVTDKILNSDRSSINSSQVHTPKTPLTPFTPHLSETANVGSPNVSNPSESRANSSKPRSRADAMLQKARDQSCENTFKTTTIASSPVHLAKTWGTPIWSTEHTLKFLEKISVTVKSDSSRHISKGRPANVKHLHGDYIKVESLQRNYRPYFQEIKLWPTINLNSKIGFSPFAAAEPQTAIKTLINQPPQTSNKTNKMTRKSRSKQMRTKHDYKRTSEKQCGYCEVCRLEYDVLSVHLQSKEHNNFVKNSDNFLSLDNLINSSANVDTFLKMNSVPPKTDYDNGVFTKRSCRKLKEMIDCDIHNDGDNVIKSDFVRLNGNGKMVTRRSNNRKSELNLDSKSCVKSSPIKLENKLNEIEGESAAQLRSRRESARRINYAEPREDDEQGEDLKTKIRIRGIRWRAPSTEEHLSSASQPAVYKIGKGTKSKDPFSDQNKDPQNGLKVRICRVRESELSLLTNEADKFMFPPCLSDRPTDEDRQSTSDREEDHQSAEILSSDVDTSKKKNSVDLSYTKLDTSVKRRRRNQLQSFLEDNSDYYKFEKPDSRLRFPETPVQSTPTTNRTMITADSNSDVDHFGDSEDRAGAKRNNQNDMLSSDVISRLKYSFERVPSSEPWFDAFQRQDECRERIFEYWGNTAYRKLPYEIGPLPPLKPNCCLLSKIAHKKVDINKVDRRFKCYRDQKKLKLAQVENQSAEVTNSKIFPATETIEKTTNIDQLPIKSSQETVNIQKDDSNELPTKVSREIANLQKDGSIFDQLPAKVSREIVNLQRDSSRTSKSKSPLIFSSNIGNRSDSKTVLIVKSTTPADANNKLSHKRNLINEFIPSFHAETKDVKVKSAISNSRRNSLLDINGQPRKSPREHASTLAILSCLVQERKKREKELNGGISPDKLPLKEDINDDDRTSEESYDEESNDTGVLSTVIKQEMDSCDEEMGGNDYQQTVSSTTLDVKLEQSEEVVNETNDKAAEINQSTKEDVKEEFKYPKLHRLGFVNPLKLYKQIDDLLSTSFSQTDPSLGSIDVPISTNPKDLILIGTPKDFVEIVASTAPGPLRYRSLVNLKKPSGLSSFSRGKKRRNNKTGWPTLPKRRIAVKKAVEDDSYSCSNLSVTDPDDEVDENPITTDDRVDISEKLENGNDEFFIHSRQKLNSMGDDIHDEYSNDGNNSILFPGTSDKAENSDIFTVSSDSLDTQLTESNNKQQLEKDYDVISMKSIVNMSDESSSADVTLAEMLKKQIGVDQKINPMRNRQKNVRKHSKKPNNIKLLQPIICVKKINDSETLNKFMTNKNSPIKEQSNVRNSSSPNTKCSPRKLRKPRGRWYRER